MYPTQLTLLKSKNILHIKSDYFLFEDDLELFIQRKRIYHCG